MRAIFNLYSKLRLPNINIDVENFKIVVEKRNLEYKLNIARIQFCTIWKRMFFSNYAIIICYSIIIHHTPSKN